MNTNQINQLRYAGGAAVYDLNGDKIGTLTNVDPQGGYLVAQHGLFFPHDVYIPSSAVTNSDADGIYLNLSKDDLGDERYKTPPALSAESGMTQSTILGEVGANVTNNRDAIGERAAPVAPLGGTGVVPAELRTAGMGAETATANDITVPIREEELTARKQQTEQGRVHLHKDVVEQPETITVPVTREEVRVERVPVQGAAAGNIGPDVFEEKDIDVPVMGERVNVEKQARVGEEIHLHKREVTEQERFDGIVRRERVEVEGLDTMGNETAGTPNAPADRP